MTTVSSLPQKAGVKCPKDTGKMDKNASCKLCEHYPKCSSALTSFMS